MSAILPPKAFRTEQNVQLSYEMPHRVYTTAAYPLRSSNGSTVIIYGHENGARIIWRGGRPFKKSDPKPVSKEQSKANGSGGDAVMIIDSDDEQPTDVPEFEDKAEFEDEEAEVDPAKPYPAIIQHLDLNFGTTVRHLAIPPIGVADNPSGLSPAILKDKIVFTVVCSDRTVRIITLPLTPPSRMSKAREKLRAHVTAGNAGDGLWGESIVLLNGHAAVPDGVSMTFVATNPGSAADGEQGRTRPSSNSRNKELKWNVLVASHSTEMSGLLLLYHVSVESKQKSGNTVYSLSKAHNTPFQTQYLSSPATTVSFNPSILASYSTHLLVTDKSAACRVYDCQASTFAGKSDETPGLPYANQGGSWLLTLHPGFQSNRSDMSSMNALSLSNFGRKAVIDAKWVLGGKAIIALLADGEWGLWDIGDAGPGASAGLLGRQNIRGGAKTGFSLSGWIDGAPVKSVSNRNAGFHTSSRFVPMTPSTRRTAEPALFNGRTGNDPVRGQISAARLPTTSTTHAADECVVFWLEDSFAVIPNLLAYWEAQNRKNGGGSSNLFGGAQGNRLLRVEGVNLRGERCCGIDQCVRSISTSKAGLPTEMIISGEHRFLIVSDGAVDMPTSIRRSTLAITGNDMQLVPSGELDILGIDQALAQMDESPSFGKRQIDLFG